MRMVRAWPCVSHEATKTRKAGRSFDAPKAAECMAYLASIVHVQIHRITVHNSTPPFETTKDVKSLRWEPAAVEDAVLGHPTINHCPLERGDLQISNLQHRNWKRNEATYAPHCVVPKTGPMRRREIIVFLFHRLVVGGGLGSTTKNSCNGSEARLERPVSIKNISR